MEHLPTPLAPFIDFLSRSAPVRPAALGREFAPVQTVFVSRCNKSTTSHITTTLLPKHIPARPAPASFGPNVLNILSNNNPKWDSHVYKHPAHYYYPKGVVSLGPIAKAFPIYALAWIECVEPNQKEGKTLFEWRSLGAKHLLESHCHS